MNIRKIANQAVQIINKDLQGMLWQFKGQKIDEAGRVWPEYTEHSVSVQVQSAPSGGMQLNEPIPQGATIRKVYVHGNLQDVSRPNKTGQDLLIFPEFSNLAKPRIWKIINTDEVWPTWCSCTVLLQNEEFGHDAA